MKETSAEDELNLCHFIHFKSEWVVMASSIYDCFTINSYTFFTQSKWKFCFASEMEKSEKERREKLFSYFVTVWFFLLQIQFQLISFFFNAFFYKSFFISFISFCCLKLMRKMYLQKCDFFFFLLLSLLVCKKFRNEKKEEKKV